jgi:polyphosphate kinase 2 (PPK2 family)
MEQPLSEAIQRKSLRTYQRKLRQLAQQLYIQERSLLIVYEGWDAGGPAGHIKRVTEKLDPRGYEVYNVMDPKGEDATHHYLWRFWRRLKPARDKQILIFNHSWYGRIMIKRIERYCTDAEWVRAGREINEFEWQLVDADIILAKFWIRLSAAEQRRRFELQHTMPYKTWKLDESDWQYRSQWQQYEQTVEDMLRRTSTEKVPWTLIEGDNPQQAHVQNLYALVTLLSHQLGYEPVGPKKKGRKKRKKSKLSRPAPHI